MWKLLKVFAEVDILLVRGHTMKLMLAFALVFVSISTLLAELADEQDNLIAVVNVGAEWDEIQLPKELKKERWTVRMFRDTKNGDLLTLARLEFAGLRSFDDAWEFAPTGYPFWFPQNKYYTINTLKTEWLDNRPENARQKVAYTVVNEHESGKRDDTIMANGFVVNIGDGAYYIQHSSKAPIPDCTARNVLRNLELGHKR